MQRDLGTLSHVRQVGARFAAAPRRPYWIGLDRQAYTAQLAELRQWADTVLRQHYCIYELRDCWPSHIHAIWELSTLAAAWHHAYGGSHPDLARALEFYDRWLPRHHAPHRRHHPLMRTGMRHAPPPLVTPRADSAPDPGEPHRPKYGPGPCRQPK